MKTLSFPCSIKWYGIENWTATKRTDEGPTQIKTVTFFAAKWLHVIGCLNSSVFQAESTLLQPFGAKIKGSTFLASASECSVLWQRLKRREKEMASHKKSKVSPNRTQWLISGLTLVISSSNGCLTFHSASTEWRKILPFFYFMPWIGRGTSKLWSN